MLFDCSASQSRTCSFYTTFLTEEDKNVIQSFLQNGIISFGKSVWNKIYTSFITLPSRFIDFFIMVFLLFFLFVDGKRVLNTVRQLLPMKIEHEAFILKTLKDTTDAIVFGQTVTAVLQGIIAGIGFWLFGVPHALLLGVIIGFLAIIPFLGSTIIYVPIAFYFILQGMNMGDNGALIKGVLLLFYGIVFISSIDNFLKPKIIGDRAKLHPAFVFIGVIGGLALFGIIGFFLGPIIFGLFLSMVQIYKKEKKQQFEVKV